MTLRRYLLVAALAWSGAAVGVRLAVTGITVPTVTLYGAIVAGALAGWSLAVGLGWCAFARQPGRWRRGLGLLLVAAALGTAVWTGRAVTREQILIRALVASIVRGDTAQSSGAWRHLEALGEPAVPQVVGALRGLPGEADVHRANVVLLTDGELLFTPAARLVAVLGNLEPPAVPELLGLLEDPDLPESTRLAVVKGLGGVGPRAGIAAPPVFALAADRARDPELRQQAIWALSRIQTEVDAMLPLLVEVLQDEGEEMITRCTVTAVLRELGPAAAPAVPALEQVITRSEVDPENQDLYVVAHEAREALEQIQGPR